MNVPNVLTALRFLLVPFFGYSLYTQNYVIAVVIFTLAGITDVMDGYIARKYNMITSWGKLADPLADKLMQITALVLLTIQRLIPIQVVIIVIAKEAFMGLGSILLYKKSNTVVAANWYGKLATVIFYFAIVMIIILRMEKLIANLYVGLIIDILVGIAVLSTLFAFFMYSLTYRRIRKSEI